MTWRQRIKQKRPITTHTSFTLFRMRVSLFQNSLTQTHTHAVWAPTFTIFFPYLYLEYSKQKTTFITPLLLLFFCEAVKLPQSTSGPSFLSVFFPVNKLSLWPPTVYCSSTKYCTVGYWWSQHFCLREIMKPSTNEHQEAYHSTTSREGERERKKDRKKGNRLDGWGIRLPLYSVADALSSIQPRRHLVISIRLTDERTDE